MPLYAVYSLLFADHGIGAAQISLLFVIWSLTSFVCEVPSGAWADSFDRRRLLVLSAAIYAVAFASWTLWQTFAGFALGFVLWGLSSSLMSGTFEALVYDELAERGLSESYPGLIGWAHSTAMVANLVATASAALLIRLGGYPVVGWVSIGFAVVQGLLAWTLPVSTRARHAPREPQDAEQIASHYLRMLRAGLAESRRHPDVRRVLLLAAAMVGLTAYDEYFPLVARAHHVATGTVPLLIAVTVAGQAVGTALTGWSARLRGRAVAGLLAVGGVLVSVGALVTPYAGFVAIGVGYGMLNNAMLVGETRLQDTITGPARATVTSVLGLLEEVVALSVYAAFALASDAFGFPVLVAALGAPVLVVAAFVARWLPDRSAPVVGDAEDS
ncbi:MAG: MFS transporter [Nocardioides sp.]